VGRPMQVWLIPIADETQRVQVSSVPAIDGIFRRLLVLSVPGRDIEESR